MGRLRRMCRREQGFILLLSWMAIVGLLVVTQSLLVRSTTELRAATRFVANQQTFQLAEAVMDDALAALNTGAGLTDWDPCDGEVPDCFQQLRRKFLGGSVLIQVFDAASDRPRVVATSFGPNAAASTAPRQLELILEDQTTYFDHAAYNPRETSIAQGAITLGFPIGGRPYEGVADPSTIHVEVDAYHSALGPYDPVTNRSTTQSSLATLAPAGSYNSMYVDKDDVIWGDVLIPAATGTVKLHNNGSPLPGVCTAGGPCPSPPVIGAVEAMQNPKRIPTVSVPTSLTSLPAGPTDLTDPLFCKDPSPSPPPTAIQPGTYGDLVLSGCTQPVELTGAGYRFHRIALDNATLVVPPATQIYLSATWNTYALVIDETADMITMGKTDIYFHSGLDFNEQAITPFDPATTKPSDLMLYGVRGAPPGVPCAAPCYPPLVHLGHDATLIGVVHNPEGWMNVLDDAQMYGSILAGRWGFAKISLTHNARLHYDLALKAGRLPIAAEASRYRIVSWREL